MLWRLFGMNRMMIGLVASAVAFGIPQPLFSQQFQSFQQFPSPQYQVVKKGFATRQNQFPVPFEMAASLRSSVKEIELVYSVDQGVHWYSYQKISPDQKKFQFHAQKDGEYWFVFRLINPQGEAKLAQTEVPSIRVLVDTQPPSLQISAKKGENGEVAIDWSIDDTALSSDAPEVYLSYDLNVTWIRLAVDPTKITKNETQRSGKTIFHPPTGTKTIDIRCEIGDTAGNREIKTIKLDYTGRSEDVSSVSQGEDSTKLSAPVVPPRPTLKKDADFSKSSTSSKSDDSGKGVLADFSIGTELAPPQNAESLPRYASNMELKTNQKTEQKPPTEFTDFELPPLELINNQELTNNADKKPPVHNATPTTAGPVEVKINDQASLAPKSEPTPSTALKLPDAQPTQQQEPVFPGKITLISLKESTTPQLVVRWFIGAETLKESKVDLYRSTNRLGPWKPVIFDLNNTGEYLWNITEEEFAPFYLRLDLRSSQGLYTDFTTREINILTAVKPK